MNIDLTITFKDARQLITTWETRYSLEEYPKKVVMNIFYRKYTIQKMWAQIFNSKFSNWETAYGYLKSKYRSLLLGIQTSPHTFSLPHQETKKH
jgi:hypothetical protein